MGFSEVPVKSIVSYLSLAVLALVSFTATAFAAGAASPEDGSLLELAKPVYEAVMGHQWWLAASLALVFLCAAAKKYAPGKLGDFLRTDHGGALLVLLMSFGGAVSTGLLAAGTGAMTLALAWAALKIALGAAGGYSLIRKLIVNPLLASTWYQEKAPAWFKSIMGLALWAFDKPTPIEKAEKAGSDAVAANPSTGAGTPTDV